MFYSRNTKGRGGLEKVRVKEEYQLVHDSVFEMEPFNVAVVL